jgi:Cys-rich repeat protein
LIDQCLEDSDCSGGAVCVCAKDMGFGLIVNINACVPSNCRVDADCAEGLCSPGKGYCGSSTGYHCRSATDGCGSDADCAGSTSANTCNYDLVSGRFQCEPHTVCGG